MRNFTTFALLLFIQFCFSQEHSLKRVLSANGIPLADVNIYAPIWQSGVFTDKVGCFDIVVFSTLNPTDTLQFSRVGYKQRLLTYEQLLRMKNVVLEEDTVYLHEVVVKSKQNKRIFLPVIELSSIPKRVLFAFGAVLVDGRIYVQGGDESILMVVGAFIDRTTRSNFANKQSFSWKAYSKRLWVYDIVQNCWAQCPQLFSPRAYHTLLLHGQKLLAIGGKKLSTSKKIEWIRSDIDIYMI